MGIVRITRMELVDQYSMDTVEELYEGIRREYSPNCEHIINVRKRPTSSISIALYPSFESAKTNLEGRANILDLLEPHLKDVFHHEGEVNKNVIPNLAKAK